MKALFIAHCLRVRLLLLVVKKRMKVPSKAHGIQQHRAGLMLVAIKTLKFPSALATAKAKCLASMEGIQDFKGSWCLFNELRKRAGIKAINLHGEGSGVDKNDHKLSCCP